MDQAKVQKREIECRSAADAVEDGNSEPLEDFADMREETDRGGGGGARGAAAAVVADTVCGGGGGGGASAAGDFAREEEKLLLDACAKMDVS